MKQIIEFFIFVLCFTNAFGQNATHSTVQFLSEANSRVSVHGNYLYHFSAIDSAGNSLNYSVNHLPSWLKWDTGTQSVSGRANEIGQYPVEIIAYTKTDTAYQHFMLTVFDEHTDNILCLGNSITNGVDTFNSYRRDLWQLLHADHYNFDFIGSWNKHHMGTAVPIPDFDMDHEGHSGWTFEDILNAPSWDSARGNLSKWINTYTPSIVLIELGTNDIFHCLKAREMFDHLDVILDLLRKKNSHVKVFLAQIPPLGAQWSDKKLCGNDTTYAEAIVNLNIEIASYAKTHSGSRSPIIAVDQFTGVDPAKDMFDDIHPNTSGERKMADRWYRAIRPYLKKL